MPEKLKCKLQIVPMTDYQMWTEMDRWMDKGNTICPFHHSLNGRCINTQNIKLISQPSCIISQPGSIIKLLAQP